MVLGTSESYCLVRRATAAFIPFAPTYLCDSRFSALLTLKTKHRNGLDAKDHIRVALSKVKPQFHVLTEEKQHKP